MVCMKADRPEQIRLVWRKIDELIPYEHNAKLHPQEQLDKLVGSFDEFGRIVPAGIDAQGNLIYGHGRILAARQRGDTEFPCIEIEGLSETQRRAFVHADNLLSQSGTDEEILRAEMQALQAAGFNVDIAGKYILAENEYLKVSALVQESINGGDGDAAGKWIGVQDKLTKQILQLGSELGITPTARRARGLYRK